MNLKFHFTICLVLVGLVLNAAIICPPDKTITCHDDINYLPLTGMPTVFGYPYALARYFDRSSNGICNAGTVIRTWYLDLNQNGTFDTGEHACLQNIYVQYTEQAVEIYWPTDKQYTCKENIVNESPDWTSGPCDMVGVSKKDQIFEVSPDACYKILRTFTVINWCTYLPGTPGWNGQGIWTHTQIIKVIEESKPVIKDCSPRIIGTDAACEAFFTISNSAFDPEVCGNHLLLWTVEIDLWADGTIDYTYGFNKDAPYKLDPVKNNEQISITLPYKFRPGHHKVTWKVRDQCGNNTSCIQQVHIKDIKKPTPYILDFLTAAFQGKLMDLRVPARIFDRGSFDNCTKSSELRFSFSPNVIDTIRIIKCNNAGFQFFTLYITDLEGNQETIDVYLLAIDNGSCNSILKASGSISEPNGTPVNNTMMKIGRPDDPQSITYSDEKGQYIWNNISLYEDTRVIAENNEQLPGRIDIADFKILQDYFFGFRTLHNFELLAADLDRDNRIRNNDLLLLKNRILYPDRASIPLWSFVVGADTIRNTSELKNLKSELKIIESAGSINFKGVYMGDISTANQKSTNPRSATMVKQKKSDSVVEFYAQNDMEVLGLQFEVKIPYCNGNLSVSSPFFTIAQNNQAYNESDHTYRFFTTGQKTFIPKDQLIIKISSEDECITESAELLKGSKMLLAEYKTSDIRVITSPDTAENTWIYPNPNQGTFTIHAKSNGVESFRDIQGRECKYTLSGDQFSTDVLPGVYLLTLRLGNQLETKKVIIK
jgi:hypothetical protein